MYVRAGLSSDPNFSNEILLDGWNLRDSGQGVLENTKNNGWKKEERHSWACRWQLMGFYLLCVYDSMNIKSLTN